MPDELQRLIKEFPQLNVMAEFNRMIAWLNVPENEKPKGSIRRFINGWLNRSARAIDKAVAAAPQHITHQQAYTQRDYAGVTLGDIPDWMLTDE